MHDEQDRAEIAAMRARLDEAHKMMDKIYGRELSSLRWFGAGISVLLAVFAGLQYLDVQRFDGFEARTSSEVEKRLKEIEERVETELTESRDRIAAALGGSTPERVVIQDALGEPGVLEFVAQSTENGFFRLHAPYYVRAEGGSGGLIGLNMTVDGRFVDFLIDSTWKLSGGPEQLIRQRFADGLIHTDFIQDYYTAQGFTLLPSDQRLWFRLTYGFQVESCEDARAIFDKLRQQDLGIITLTPVVLQSHVAETVTLRLAILDDLDDRCLAKDPTAGTTKPAAVAP